MTVYAPMDGSSAPFTAKDQVCGIGQGERCGEPVAQVIAIAASSPSVYDPEKPDGHGIVYLCSAHAIVAPALW